MFHFMFYLSLPITSPFFSPYEVPKSEIEIFFSQIYDTYKLVEQKVK